MQQSKTKLQTGHSDRIGRKTEPEDIDFLVEQLPKRTIYELALLDYLPEISYENALLYCKLLYQFLKTYYPEGLEEIDKRNSYKKTDLLVDVMADLESTVQGSFAFIEYDDFGEGYIHIHEYLSFLHGKVYDLNFDFPEMDFDENLKTGISHALEKIMTYCGMYNWDKDFLKTYVKYEMEYVLDQIADEEYKGKEQEFKSDVRKMMKVLVTKMSAVIQYSKKKFDRKKEYTSEDEIKLKQSIITILDFNWEFITNHREQSSDYEDYGDGTMQFEYLFIPKIYSENYNTTLLFDTFSQNRCDEFGQMGCEAIMKHYTIWDGGSNFDINPDQEKALHELEEGLKNFCFLIDKNL